MIENKKPVIITIVLLVLVILGLSGYIIYDKLLVNKIDDEPTTVTIGDVEIRPEAFYQIYNTLTKFDRAFNYEDSNFFGYIYKDKKIEVDKFDKQAALYATLRNDMIATTEPRVIPEPVVKSKFEEMYGDNLKYEAKVIDAADNYSILYNQDSGYSYVSKDIINAYTSGIVSINAKTAVENGTIIVTRKVFYVEYTPNEVGVVTTATIYNDISKQQKLGNVSIVKKGLNIEEILGKFSSKLSTYNFIFRENSSNNNYALYRIERTR